MHRLYAAFQREGGTAQLHKLPLTQGTTPAPRIRSRARHSRPALGVPGSSPGVGNISVKRWVAEGCVRGAQTTPPKMLEGF